MLCPISVAFHLHKSNLGFLSCPDPKMPRLSPLGSQNSIFCHSLGNKKGMTLTLCSAHMNAAIPLPQKWFRVRISFRSQNAEIEPSGQPKWHFWSISWEHGIWGTINWGLLASSAPSQRGGSERSLQVNFYSLPLGAKFRLLSYFPNANELQKKRKNSEYK